MNAEILVALYVDRPTNVPAPSPRERVKRSMTTNLQPEPSGGARDENASCAAFDAALEDCRNEVQTYLRSRVHHVDTAADLLQGIYARATRYRYAPQLEEPRSMLFRIANNLLSDHQRYECRHHAGEHVSLYGAGPLPAAEQPPERLVDAQQALLALRHAIAALPPKCRLAFIFSRFDGLTKPSAIAQARRRGAA